MIDNNLDSTDLNINCIYKVHKCEKDANVEENSFALSILDLLLYFCFLVRFDFLIHDYYLIHM